MARRRRTGLRLSLEIEFEPWREGRSALVGAYLRLLPRYWRPIGAAPGVRQREEACDATSNILDTSAAGDPSPRGAVRPGVLGSADRAALH